MRWCQAGWGALRKRSEFWRSQALSLALKERRSEMLRTDQQVSPILTTWSCRFGTSPLTPRSVRILLDVQEKAIRQCQSPFAAPIQFRTIALLIVPYPSVIMNAASTRPPPNHAKDLLLPGVSPLLVPRA